MPDICVKNLHSKMADKLQYVNIEFDSIEDDDDDFAIQPARYVSFSSKLQAFKYNKTHLSCQIQV